MKHLHTSLYAAISVVSLAAALLQPEPIEADLARWSLDAVAGTSQPGQMPAPSAR